MIRLAACLVLWLATSICLADDDAHPVTLWQADGTDNTIYLLGSIHLLRAEDHPLPRVIDTAYDDAEVIVMELDMDDLDPVYTQAAFNAAGVMTDGSTLQEIMGEDLYAQAEAAAEPAEGAAADEAEATTEEAADEAPTEEQSGA